MLDVPARETAMTVEVGQPPPTAISTISYSILDILYTILAISYTIFNILFDYYIIYLIYYPLASVRRKNGRRVWVSTAPTSPGHMGF